MFSIWWLNIKWKKRISSVIPIYIFCILESLSQPMQSSYYKMRTNIQMYSFKCFKTNNSMSLAQIKLPRIQDKLKFSNKFWKLMKQRLSFLLEMVWMKRKARNFWWKTGKRMHMYFGFLSKMIKISRFQIFLECILFFSIVVSERQLNTYLYENCIH